MTSKQNRDKNIQNRISDILKKLTKEASGDHKDVIDLLVDIQKNNSQLGNNFNLDEIFESMQTGVVIYEAAEKGKDFKIVDFNAAAEKIENLKKKDVIGKKVTKVFPGVIEFGLLDVLKDVWKTGISINHPITIYEDERIKGWRENFVCKLQTGELVAVYMDVTEQKRAEEKVINSELNLKSLINNRKESIWSIDKDYNFIIFNDFLKEQYYKSFKRKLEVGINALDQITGELYDFWKEKYDRALSGEKYSFEFTADIGKSTHCFEVSLNPIISNNKITGVSAFSADITERKKAEKANRISEENYKGIFNTSSDAIYIQDKNGVFIDVNEGVQKMYGYKRNSFIGKTPEFISAPGKNDLNAVMRAVAKAYNGEEQEFEYWGLRKSGEAFPKDVRLSPGKYNGEKVVIAVAQDISERKKAEEEFRKSELNYKDLLQFAPDAFFQGDTIGNFIECNEAASKLTGFLREELLRMNMRDLFSSETITTKPLRYDLLKSGKVIKTERELARKDGKKIIIEMNSKKMEDGTFLSFIRDITDRKKSENALRDSESLFRNLSNSTASAVFVYQDEKFVFVNKSTEELTGFSGDELLDMKFWDVVHPDYKKIIKERGLARQKGKKVPNRYEMKILKKDGSEAWIDFTAGIINWNGRIAAIGSAFNITNQKNAEKKLKKNEEKYRLITDSTSDYLFSAQVPKDGNSKMDWVSNSFEKITGYTFSEFMDKGSWAENLHPEDLSIDKVAFEKLKNNKKIEIEVRLFNKKEKIIWLRCSTTPVWSKKEQRVITIYGAVKDITEEKNAELAIQESEAKYRLITNLTSDYLFSTIIDKNGESIPTWVGGSFKEITGYTFEEYKKRGGWTAMLHPEDIVKDAMAFEKLRNDEKVEIEVRTFHKSGKIVWIKTFGSPVWDKKKKMLIGINGACTDITKEKLASIALEESEKKYKLISNITSDYLFESRLNEKNILETVWVAGSFEIMTGYRLDEYKENGDWFGLLYKDDIEIDSAALENIKQNSEAIVELRTHHKDGRVIWVRNTCSPIWDKKNDKFLGVIGAVKDISEEKQNQIIHEVQYNIANAIVNTTNNKKLFQTVKDELNKILDTTNFYIAFYDEKSRMLTTGIDSDEKDNIETWPVEKSISGVVINSNTKLFIRKEKIIELAETGEIDLFGTVPEVWLGVPLKLKDKAIGIMATQHYSNRDAYDNISVDLFEVIGNQLSLYLEKNKAKEDALRLSRAIVQSPVSVVITNLNGEIEYVNPNFEITSGYTFKEVVGQNPRILKSGTMPQEFYQNLWQTILAGNDWNGEFLNKRKNGDIYWENAVISPIENDSGQITHFVAIKEDITEKKKMIEELISSKEKAEVSEKIKTEFLAQMSHEIRSPLNVILSFVGLFKENIDEITSADIMQSFESIESASARITRTIDLILNMTDLQLGSYKFSLEEIDVVETLNNIQLEYSRSASRKGIELRLNILFNSKIIYSDKYAFIQIVSNLVDNAIKYSEQGYIDILVDQNEKNDLILEVKDMGIGMSEEYLPEIFNSFSQEEQGYTRTYDGNGLGMALVKKYCDTINATISAVSKKGEGTTINLVIPSMEK